MQILNVNRPVFLVSFTDPNKQLPNAKSVSTFLNMNLVYISSIYHSLFNCSIYIYLLLFYGHKYYFFSKQCPLKFMSDNK